MNIEFLNTNLLNKFVWSFVFYSIWKTERTYICQSNISLNDINSERFSEITALKILEILKICYCYRF